jgi:hypothetical protein
MPGDDPMPRLTAVKKLAYSRIRPWATPKKSPTGASTDGVSSPSHQQRRIPSRKSVGSGAISAR